MDRLDIYLASWLGGALVLAAAILLWRRDKVPGRPLATRIGYLAIHALWFAALIKAAYIYEITSQGWATRWSDDPVRYMMTLDYRYEFQLGPRDHVWPGGPFVILGAWMNLFDNPAWAMRFLMLLYSAGSVLAAGWVAWLFSRSALGAFVTALFVAHVPVHTQLSTGAMTEVPTSFYMLISVALALKGWHRLRQCWCGGLYLLAAGFAATLASSHRYEGWMFLAVFGILGFLHMVWSYFGDRLPGMLQRNPDLDPPRGYVFWFAGASALALLFPIAWAIDSWMVHESPLAFYKNQVGMNTENLEGSLFQRLTYMIVGMGFQMGALWGWVVAGILVVALFARKRPQAAFGAAVLLGFCLLYILITAMKGTGVARDRYAIPMVLCVAPFIGVAVGIIPHALKQLRPAPTSLSVLAILCAAYSTWHYALETAWHHRNFREYGFRPESVMVAQLINSEFRHPQVLPGIFAGGRVVLWNPAEPADDFMLSVPALVGHPLAFVIHRQREFPDWLANERNLTILRFGPPIESPPDRFIEVGKLPFLTIFHDRESFPAAPEGAPEEVTAGQPE